MTKAISTEFTTANTTAIVTILAQSPGRVETLSALYSPEQLRQPLGPGERSFTEVLAHMINCEGRSSEAIYLALLASEPYFVDIHPERHWGKLLRHDLFEPAELVAYFKFRRQILLRVLNSLTEDQWMRVIREEGKQRKESVYRLARSIAMHEIDHVGDLEDKLPNIKA
jgi:hypothetical protein